MADNNTQYVALARKYRPQTFEDLLGQDALVQTLTNAIQTIVCTMPIFLLVSAELAKRLPHA